MLSVFCPHFINTFLRSPEASRPPHQKNLFSTPALLKFFMWLKMTSLALHSTDFLLASSTMILCHLFFGSSFLPNLRMLGLLSALSGLYILLFLSPPRIFSSWPVALNKI